MTCTSLFPPVVPSGERHSVLRNSFTWKRATDHQSAGFFLLWDLWGKQLCLPSTRNRYISSPSGLISIMTRLRLRSHREHSSHPLLFLSVVLFFLHIVFICPLFRFGNWSFQCLLCVLCIELHIWVWMSEMSVIKTEKKWSEFKFWIQLNCHWPFQPCQRAWTDRP